MSFDEEIFSPTAPTSADPLPRAATAIPTMYAGVMYRSRLEARWAVFLESLGVRALYEQEAFELGDGTNYLPDFWLPDIALFVEVKPVRQAFLSDAWRKCEALAVGTGRPVMLVVGAPGDWANGRHFLHDDRGTMFFTDGGSDEPYVPCACPHCGRIEWQWAGYADRIKCACPKTRAGDKGPNFNAPRIVEAAKFANALNLGVR